MIDLTTDQHIRIQSLDRAIESAGPGSGVDMFLRYARSFEKYIREGIPGDVQLGLSQSQLEEMDRNARAYGWEIGSGRDLASQLEGLSEENPFMDPDWRHRLALRELHGRTEEVPQPEPETVVADD